ncbi:MAG: hypothetical protein ACXVYY_06085 [Oryzihumus sp.]
MEPTSEEAEMLVDGAAVALALLLAWSVLFDHVRSARERARESSPPLAAFPPEALERYTASGGLTCPGYTGAMSI